MTQNIEEKIWSRIYTELHRGLEYTEKDSGLEYTGQYLGLDK